MRYEYNLVLNEATTKLIILATMKQIHYNSYFNPLTGFVVLLHQLHLLSGQRRIIASRSFHVSASVAPTAFFLLLHIYFYTGNYGSSQNSAFLSRIPTAMHRRASGRREQRLLIYEFEDYLKSGKDSEASRTDHDSDCSASYSLTT